MLANTIKAESISDKQFEYMNLIAEIMEIRKRGEKPLAFIRTYGCQQNVADSEKIKGMLSRSGFDFTDTPEDADFIVDEVFLRNDELYAKAIDEDGDEVEFMLYPIGENEFGRKGGMLKLTFCDDCVAYDDLTCKKL